MAISLNHLNLVLAEPAKFSTLLQTHFHFTLVEEKGNGAIIILQGEDGFSFVLMQSKQAPAIYPDAFHLGFMLTTTVDVDTLHQKLLDAGVDVPSNPSTVRNGYGFYFTFDGVMIEVACV